MREAAQAVKHWRPDHPETADAWLAWQIVLNGKATLTEVREMTLDEMADITEAIMVADDVQRHTQGDPRHG